MHTAKQPNDQTDQMEPIESPEQKAPEARLYSQEDVDKLVASRLGRERRTYDQKLHEATKLSADKVAELESKLAELSEQSADAGKPGPEKQFAEYQRNQKKLEQTIAELAKERDSLRSQAEKAVTQHREYLARTALTEALLGQKAIRGSVKDAVDLLMLHGKIETDENGALVVEYDGKVYEDLNKAADDFLSKRPHLRAHPGGGMGTKSGNGSGLIVNDEMNPGSLLRQGLQRLK